MSQRWTRSAPALLVGLGLAAAVVAVYWPVGGNGFVVYDDGEYVTQNPWVLGGLTLRGIAWTFTSFHSSNWHPLAWLSHMADVELFALDPGPHHWVSVGWHAAATAALFAWLRAATGSLWRSAAVAAVFGLHPLHVESVAWIAERKDVLSGFFWMLTLVAYTSYARRPGPWRYLAVTVALAAGLLSKPMVVSLPVVLMLVDLWPLRRMEVDHLSWASVRPLLAEKLPWLAMSAAVCLLTLLAQVGAGATRALEALPWSARLANASVSYVGYLGKALWPWPLAVFYPHPAAAGGLAGWKVAASSAALAALTYGAITQARRRPFLTVGWSWFLVTLIPVIGLVQVGSQAMADRYTYVPLVGVLFAAAWSLPDASRRPVLRVGIAAVGAAALIAMAGAARAQVAVWKDTFTLFRHAADVTQGNWIALKNLGVEYFRRGDLASAARSFEASVEAWPRDPAAWMNLAAARSALGDHAGAAEAIRSAVRLRPGDVEAWYLLGLEGHLAGRPEILAEALERLTALRPEAAQDLIRATGASVEGPAR